MLTITITEQSGQCRWCGCTHLRPCPEGCGWANRAQTVCTSCVEFDRMIQSKKGRRAIVERFIENYRA